ncbi:MAG: thiamine phosphate synthase [bacterium]
MPERPLGSIHLVYDLDVVDVLPDASARLDRLLAAGLPSLQFRAPNRTAEERRRRGAELLARAREAGALFVVNGDVETAIALRADGVHLPARLPAPADVRSRLPEGMLLGAAAHDARELERARGGDWVLLSPVCATLSKPGAATLGIPGFAALAATSTVPAYALGGVDLGTAAACFRAGATGIAAVRALLGPDGPELVRLAEELAAAP